MMTPEKAVKKDGTKYVEELKTCPKCGFSRKYEGPIRCPKCNVFLLNEKELTWQKKNLYYSDRGRDENAQEQNEKLKEEYEQRGLIK